MPDDETTEPTFDGIRRGATPRLDPTFLVVLVAGSAITAIAMGIRASMGVFLDPITDDLGMGAGTFALAMAIQNLAWGIGQPVAGALADRHGTRRVLFGGTVFYVLGMVVMAGSGGAAGLHLSGFLSGMGMAGASFTVVLAAVGRLAPEERRSMALGIATAAGSVGQFLFVPLASVAINTAGWRTALLLGAVVLAAMAVLCMPMRVESGDGGSTSSEPLSVALRRAAAHRSYVLLVVGFFVCGFHVSFIAVHLPKHLDDLGQTATIGAMALAFVGLFNVVGTLGAGALGANHDRPRLLALIYGLRAVVIAAFLLLPAGAPVSLAFGAAMGLLWLSTVPLTSGVVMAQFGVAHAGTLFGIAFLSHQVGAFVGIAGGGWIRDATGSYEVWWWVQVALGVVGAFIHLLIDDSPAPAYQSQPLEDAA